MTALFSPFRLKDVTLRNRIAVPPMCQYSAEDGFVTDWHLPHYAGMARGGAGLVIVEATAVAPEGRISPYCTGLWDDAQIDGLAKIARAIKQAGAIPGIQIAHAGRKASANRPWEGDDHLPDNDPRGWETLGPSPIAFGGGLPKIPREMTLADIARVEQNFVDTARRARLAGFEWLELHLAHGYLAQSFFSEHSNQRTDSYGGSADNRGRFALETVQATRKIWPENLPFTARFGVIEYDGRDEQTLAESIELVKKFKAEGLDLLSASVGFSTPAAKIPWGPAFLAPVAERVRREAGLPIASAWGFDAAADAARAVDDGVLDVVMIGRAHLANPHYGYRLAQKLGVKPPEQLLPAPYGFWLERYHAPEV